jgi:hypothetical protein
MALVAKTAGADGARPDFVIKPVRNAKQCNTFATPRNLLQQGVQRVPRPTERSSWRALRRAVAFGPRTAESGVLVAAC